MHTTPSHVALDTTGTLNGRTSHLATRTLQVLAASIVLTYCARGKSVKGIRAHTTPPHVALDTT